MGSPKALLTLNGVSFADALIAAFAPCDEIVVVLGHDCRAYSRRYLADGHGSSSTPTRNADS